MVTSYKYIVLVIIFFIIIYNFRRSEKFDNITDNQIIFNADEYLNNLTEDESKKMLVSSKTLPWVKFMETETAEIIYNKLLGGKKKSVKKLIAGRKRVIHTGPRGGKYYIRIRNSKKVKIYI